MSIGFQVKNIDAAIERIKSKTKISKAEENREYVPSFGIVQKITDTVNHIAMDVFCKKSDYEAQARRGDKLLEAMRKEVKQVVDPNVKKEEYEIDLNHLRGMANILSAGAIHVVPPKEKDKNQEADQESEKKWYNNANHNKPQAQQALQKKDSADHIAKKQNQKYASSFF